MIVNAKGEVILNTNQLTLEYYNKFPTVLRDALKCGKVQFPNSLQCRYEELSVFRGVKYTKNKTEIEKSDFFSQIERKKINPMVMADDSNIADYSCSVYINLEELHQRTKFPNKSMAIAKGTIKNVFGPINMNKKTSHIDLFLFNNVNPSNEFEVIEIWGKNGSN